MDLFAHEESYRGKKALEAVSSFGNITVCGCGALGSNLIDTLLRQGFRHITVIDMDRIEDHNRNTQLWGRREIGQLKATAMRYRAYNDMGIQIRSIEKELDSDNIGKFLSGSMLVVDCFDNTESRALLKSYCTKMPCLHIGLSADYAEVLWNENYSVPKKAGPDVCEYPLARNTALLSVTVGAEVIVRYAVGRRKENYTITLGDFSIQKFEE